MTDQAKYEWWQNALNGNLGKIHDGHPEIGFYRKRAHKNGPWQAVAIWEDESGHIVAKVDHQMAESAEDLWTWVCKYPITHEAYTKAMNGEGWADDIGEAPTPGIGDNQPPSGAEALLAMIEEAERDALKELGDGITTQDQADRAANWRDRLLAFSKDAEAKRKEEKKPHDDAGKAVQAKWKPIVDRATQAAGKVRAALTVFLNEQERKRREEEAKARAEAEKAAQTGEPAAEPAVEQMKAPVKAGTGARVTALRTKKYAVITDYEKALAHFAESTAVRETVERLCQAAARADSPVPGVEIKEEKVAA